MLFMKTSNEGCLQQSFCELHCSLSLLNGTNGISAMWTLPNWFNHRLNQSSNSHPLGLIISCFQCKQEM